MNYNFKQMMGGGDGGSRYMQDFMSRFSVVNNVTAITANEYYKDQGIQMDQSFDTSDHYFFRLRIKGKIERAQIFEIYLINSTYKDVPPRQFIKRVVIPAQEGWACVDLVFTPHVIGFNMLVPHLDRSNWPSTIDPTPVIVFEQCAKILECKDTSGAWVKLGINGLPYAGYCINGEEMHAPASGVFELKSSLVPIVSFGAFAGASMDYDISEITESTSKLNETKSYIINPFIADIIYEV